MLQQIQTPPDQDAAYAWGQAWIVIEKGQGVSGTAAQQTFNHTVWKALRGGEGVKSFKTDKTAWAKFFNEKMQQWLQDALNVMEQLDVEPPTSSSSLGLAAGPATVKDDASAAPRQITFTSVPFPGLVGDDVQAVLNYIESARSQDSSSGRASPDTFEDVVAASCRRCEQDPPSFKPGACLWVPSANFLSKSFAHCQLSMVEHDRALNLRRMWETDGRGRAPDVRESGERRRQELRLQLCTWLADVEHWG